MKKEINLHPPSIDRSALKYFEDCIKKNMVSTGGDLISKFEKKIRRNPYNYVAQPTLALSTCPIYTKKGLTPRHVDLRSFALLAKNNIHANIILLIKGEGGSLT